MRISVIGTGYVGIVSGACFAETGHHCMCVDIDPGKVARINDGQAPIHEIGLNEILARHVGSRLFATTDLAKAVQETEITFIAVGTPFDGQRIDLTYIREAARQIGAALRTKTGWHTVVVKSTVVPGTTDDVVRGELEAASGKRAGIDFGVGMNPEFLTEGTAVRDFMHPDRIVIGGSDARTFSAQREVYAQFASTPTIEVNNKTAEMIKYASNSVLATLISFSNEIGNLCSTLGGVDVADVMRGVHLARYFSMPLLDGTRAQAGITSFLWAGCGYGGSCLPKDTKALSSHAVAHGMSMPLLDAVIATNVGQPGRMLDLLRKHFTNFAGVRIGLLGLAFKEDTDDIRESPAIPIARQLLDQGAIVVGYDPLARETARAALPSAVTLVDSLQEAVAAADAIVLVTRWNEFRELPGLLSGMTRPPLLVDGRRIVDPNAVPRYEGIGA
jgi:UDPglucose 6-dehydrogenase/GDP-mannose 6-dehydrogenase